MSNFPPRDQPTPRNPGKEIDDSTACWVIFSPIGRMECYLVSEPVLKLPEHQLDQLLSLLP